MVVLIIFSIKVSDKIFSKIGFNIFEYSFGDGNLNYTIEVITKKEIDSLKNNENLVTLQFDKENKNYSYRLVFRERAALLNFENSIKDNQDIINLRADMQS